MSWFNKVTYSGILSSVFWIGVSTASVAPRSDIAVKPNLVMTVSPTLDSWICGDQEMMTRMAWTKEALDRVSEFQRRWDTEGLSFLLNAIGIVGKPYPRNEDTVTLMVCPKLPALGDPILLPISMFLKSALGDKTYDLSIFSGYLFHETLHRYVYSILPFYQLSPLKVKYVDQKPMVIAHIHLFAIMTTVLESMSRHDILDFLYKIDSNYSPDYQRAWDIVKFEGPEQFLNELRR